MASHDLALPFRFSEGVLVVLALACLITCCVGPPSIRADPPRIVHFSIETSKGRGVNPDLVLTKGSVRETRLYNLRRVVEIDCPKL